MKMIMNLINGFCMALADSVPGVSGGTIAFLLGFYDKFITSLDHLIKGTKEERIDAIIFLIKIGIGWVVGFILAMLILGSIFEKHIYNISSLFLGFVVFAIPLIIIEEKAEFKGKYKNIIFAIIGLVLVIAISSFSPAGGDSMNLAWGSFGMGTAIYVFIAAAIAISAMVLPGISGSTLLLIFGLYVPVMNCIKSVLSFQLEALPPVILFGMGIVVGIVTVVRLVKIALERYRSQTVYSILGLMIGSLYAIVMGATTLEVPKEAMSISTFSIVFFAIGGIMIIGLQMLKKIQS